MTIKDSDSSFTPLVGVHPSSLFVKRAVVTAMLAGTGAVGRPDVIAEVAAVGYEAQGKEPDIELATVLAVQDVLVARLFPNEERVIALHKIGYLSLEGYRQTVLGRVLTAALEVWTPPRLLKASPQVWRAVLRYGDRRAEQLGSHSFALHHDDEPGYIETLAGITLATLDATGAKNSSLEIVSSGRPNCYSFIVKWE